MDKYTEALNYISNYEIWHTATYDDDGYCNDDDWTEYPFSESEDIKLLSELITKHDTLNKGIDELINEYNNSLINCIMFPKIGDNKVIGYVLDKIIKDLNKLKGE